MRKKLGKSEIQLEDYTSEEDTNDDDDETPPSSPP